MTDGATLYKDEQLWNCLISNHKIYLPAKNEMCQESELRSNLGGVNASEITGKLSDGKW